MNQVAVVVAFVLALGLIAMGYGVNSSGVDLFETGFLSDNGLLDSVNKTEDEDSLLQEPSLSGSGSEGGG